jgi:hypothetical protein
MYMSGGEVLARLDNVGGAEVTIAAMDEDARLCIGQSTFFFVKRLLRDPELRKLHEKKKAELKASGFFDQYSVGMTGG